MSNLFCEWLFQFLFPNLYSKIIQNQNITFYNYLNNLNNLKSNYCENSGCDAHDSLFYTSINGTVHLTSDLINHFNTCTHIESNFLYLLWILNIFKPLMTTLFVILFILPICLALITYFTSIYLFLSKHWRLLRVDFYNQDIWETSLKSLCILWETIGDILHGYEMIGMENIPDSGPALYIYYHAAMPIDFYYGFSKILLHKNRKMKIIADKFLFKIPGLGSLLDLFEVTPGTKEKCVEILKEGHILSISPGGVREALFSDHNYGIIWGNRAGFANVAVEAKCPIIPVFTQNSREFMRTLPFKFFRVLYEKTRLPLVPIYGLFPVKMRTIIGKPIEYDETKTAEEVKALTKLKIEEMIQKHQRLPGNIFLGILDRFRKFKVD